LKLLGNLSAWGNSYRKEDGEREAGIRKELNSLRINVL